MEPGKKRMHDGLLYHVWPIRLLFVIARLFGEGFWRSYLIIGFHREGGSVMNSRLTIDDLMM